MEYKWNTLRNQFLFRAGPAQNEVAQIVALSYLFGPDLTMVGNFRDLLPFSTEFTPSLSNRALGGPGVGFCVWPLPAAS